MQIPKTRLDLEQLISARVQEDIHLDYKDSRALFKAGLDELSKDVSAFANADGGLLVYGIRERDHVPDAIDDGVDPSQVSKEQLENKILANIAPRLEGVRIHPIALSESRWTYVIEVPKSFRGPHQDRCSKRYYKRQNFQAVPMEDYEVADLRTRARTVAPLVSFDIEVRRSNLILFVVTNPGEVAAIDVTFDFSETLTWRGEVPGFVRRGIRMLPPRREFRVLYGTGAEILAPTSNACSAFEVTMSYFHPIVGERLAEVFVIDLNDYVGTWSPPSAVAELTDALKDRLSKIDANLKKLTEVVEGLMPIAGPSGLALSVGAVESLARSFGHEPVIAKQDPSGKAPRFFTEVLGVNDDLARALWLHFQFDRPPNTEDVEGMSPELMAKIDAAFLRSIESP